MSLLFRNTLLGISRMCTFIEQRPLSLVIYNSSESEVYSIPSNHLLLFCCYDMVKSKVHTAIYFLSCFVATQRVSV
jgi:hypothetical protein